jgi:hypothetical protein
MRSCHPKMTMVLQRAPELAHDGKRLRPSGVAPEEEPAPSALSRPSVLAPLATCSSVMLDTF